MRNFGMYCPTPGRKIRSRGLGRGLARGRGLGPRGVPFGRGTINAGARSILGRKPGSGDFSNLGF